VVKVVNLKLLVLTAVDSNPDWDWILSCEETMQLVYGTLVVLLGCPCVPEIMHQWAPEVKLGSCNMTNTMLGVNAR
jgi:hypothetical protein